MSLTWQEVTSSPLLGRCYAVSVTWCGRLYLHGGLPTTQQKGAPLRSLVCWDPGNNTVTEVDRQGPALSHHTGNIVGNCLVLVGGWDGKNRGSKVDIFNLETNNWLSVEHREERSNPPFGLSGHTTTRINQALFCVLGREGGLKIQRKFGDIFLLHLNIKSEHCSYWWAEAPVKTKSRSGHAALLAPSLKFGDLFGLFVFGGRDDETVHKCGQWPHHEVDIHQEESEDVFNYLSEMVKTQEISKPEGLRYHTMIKINDRCIIVHGGQNFKSRNNISNKTLVCLNRRGDSHWFSFTGGQEGARAAHGMVLLDSKVFIVGGMDGKVVKDNVARLHFVAEE